MRADYDVYIGRGPCPKTGERSIWGNPFKDGTREENIERFRQYLLSRKDLLEQLPTLKGKVLGCWCGPKPCHGEVILDLLFAMEENQ